mgnify:CR=1 FL=1
MNKTELVAAVAQKAELSKKDAEKAVAAVQQLLQTLYVQVIKYNLLVLVHLK